MEAEEVDVGAAFAARLPQEIQAALKRKSSRDPNSRFPRKLHLLLTYLATDPVLEEDIGLSWTSDVEFRMKKKNVAAVMGIKLNTMNVNLRDLGFEQLQHDKNGWTEWKRDGFTRTSVFYDTNDLNQTDPNAAQSAQVQASAAESQASKRKQAGKVRVMAEPQSLFIGQVTPLESNAFNKLIDDIWMKLAGNMFEMPCDMFVNKAAMFFKQPEQPTENAVEVIKAIIAPAPKPMHKEDLYRFMAMFGPEKTAMLKIASLLLCSNNNGNWLYFDPGQLANTFAPLTGSFDKTIPNCLVLKYNNGTIRKVWNHPMIDAYGSYLIDEQGTKYLSWDKYFEPHYPETTFNY